MERIERGGVLGPPVRVPLVLRCAKPSWSSQIPDFRESSRLGHIVAGTGTEASLEALARDPEVFGIEGSRTGGLQECATSVPFVGAHLVHRPPLGEEGDECIVGLIDTGLDVLHRAFRDGYESTRILELWDQTTGGGPSLRAPYGTVHSAAEINSCIATNNVPAGLRRDPNGHGTHVASIAAGRATGQFAGGVAPAAKIVAVIVDLAPGPGGQPGRGYSNTHIDALRFIQDVAKREGLPVVVNVSLGMNAGAHDGTSALEAAFDEFSSGGRAPGYVVVKSAGNEHGQRAHARLRINRKSQEAFTWESLAKPRSEDVIELWFKPGDELSFRLTHPDGTTSMWVDKDTPTVADTLSGNRCQMTFVRYHGDNGDSRLLVTIMPGDTYDIAHGRWKLDVRSGDVRSGGLVDAWIEMIDPYSRVRPLFFITHQDEETTLTIPGTARSVITVASVHSATPYQLSAVSSYGPTRDGREKPDLAAPGEEIIAAQRGTPDSVERRSGTSMACPHVAGAIALLLSRRHKRRFADPTLTQLTAAQITSALTLFTQNSSGSWSPGMGYGVLDVDALLKAFE